MKNDLWNTDMSAAPKNETVKQTFVHHQSGKSYAKEVAMKVPILISVSGQVIKSFWSDTRGQWVGIAQSETPDAWMPWPEPYQKD